MKQLGPKTWYKTGYIEETDAYIALSDIFYNLFRYLGNEILIFDPYFIGNIVEDKTTKALSVNSECQKAFLNAIARHLFETGFSARFIICGCRQRAKSQITKDTNIEQTKIEDLYRKYQIYLNKMMPPHKLYPEYVEIVETSESFHNRYYFSKNTNDKSITLSKPIVVTNSIGNIEEIDIMPVEDASQSRVICSRYAALLSSANSISGVYNG